MACLAEKWKRSSYFQGGGGAFIYTLAIAKAEVQNKLESTCESNQLPIWETARANVNSWHRFAMGWA